MKFSLAILAAAAPAVTGARLKKHVSAKSLADADLSGVEVKASSKVGNKLLSKARRLDGDGDYTWIAGYSLKFHSCATSQDYYGGYFENDNNGGNGQGNYNYNNNGENGQGNNNYNYDGQYYNDREDYEGMYMQKLVHFKLCPSDSCWRCKNGADYVVELGDFAQAILEAKLTEDEYNCQQVRENCYCDEAYNEDACYYNCYKNAGLRNCVEGYDEADYQFNLQEAMECSQLEVEDEEAVANYIWANMAREQNYGYYDANGNGQQDQGDVKGEVYVGPYCKGNKILLGLFLEDTCSIEAPSGLYEATHYGASLPHSKKSVLGSGCISCKQPKEVDYNNYNYQNQEADEPTEVCTDLYEMAGKCEENLDGYYPNRDVTGCGFISNLKSEGIHLPNANVPAKVLAGIFAAATLIFAGISYTLFKRNQRQNVILAEPAFA